MTDFKEFEKVPKNTNYAKWAYKLLVYLFILNLLSFYMTYKGSYAPATIVFFNLLNYLFLISGSVLTLISILNKEKKNNQYYISMIGYSVFLIIQIGLLFFYS